MAAFFGFAALGEGAFVCLGGRLFDDGGEASWPEVFAGDDVCFGCEQGDVGGQVDPGEEADDEAEGAVEVAGVFEGVADVVATEGLQ